LGKNSKEPKKNTLRTKNQKSLSGKEKKGLPKKPHDQKSKILNCEQRVGPSKLQKTPFGKKKGLQKEKRKEARKDGGKGEKAKTRTEALKGKGKRKPRKEEKTAGGGGTNQTSALGTKLKEGWESIHEKRVGGLEKNLWDFNLRIERGGFG